jgi:hypothetical protein
MPRRAPSRRPIDDLPTPIIPINTIERSPSRDTMAGAGLLFVDFCAAISVIYVVLYPWKSVPMAFAAIV